MSDDELVSLFRASRCIDCDYRLRGLKTQKCPECGRRFDLGDPTTFKVIGPLSILGNQVVLLIIGILLVPIVALVVLFYHIMTSAI